MKKALIIIGVVGLVGVGVGYYIYKNQNKLNDSDFDAMIGLSKNKGACYKCLIVLFLIPHLH